MSETKMKRILAPLFLFFLPFIFFARILTGNTIFMGDFSGSDLINLHLPFRQVLHNSIISGQVPLWKNGLALGFPAFAEGQTGSLYPPNLILSVLSDPILSLNFSILVVFIISLLSSYWYFRLTKNSQAASVFGAIAYTFSSFFITRIKHLNMINVASLFPLLLLFTELYFERRKLGYAISVGIVCALAIFAGHPQMAYYTFLVVSLYAFFKTFRTRAKVGIGPKLKEYLVFLFIVLVIGLGISTVQMLPTLELASLSRRLNTTGVLNEDFSYHPSNIISLVSPYYFGNPAYGTYKKEIKSFGVFWENSTYIGITPLFIALLFLPTILINKKEDRHSLFFIFLAIFSFLVMLGVKTPLIFILAKFIPLFSIFRFPTRFNLFLIFSLVFLAVRGFDFFLNRLKDSSRKAFSIILILLLILDLYLFADAFVAYLPAEILRKPPNLVSVLKEEKKFRIYSLTQYQKNVFDQGWKDPKEFLEAREGIPPNDNILYDLDSLTDRGWFEGGLSLAKRNDLESYILLGAYFNPELIGKVLGMYNVKYLISQDARPSSDFKKVGESGNINFYENNQVLPRTYIVPGVIPIKNEEDFFRVVSSSDFDPEKSVILQSDRENNSYFLGELANYKRRNRIENIEYKDGEVNIKTSILDSGYLVLSDAFYPGWEAVVNKRKVPILRANHTVRAIEVRPGDSEIKFVYEPTSFEIGKVVTFTTLLVLVLISISQIKTKKRLVLKYG